MSNRWPPPGHRHWYNIKEELSAVGSDDLAYDVSVPDREEVDLATARVQRHGGPSRADDTFRSKLYYLIGAATVMAGHAESAMKRVILVANGRSGKFSIVDKTWTALEADLRSIAQSTHVMAAALAQILADPQLSDAKRRRDNIVHAYWWDYDLGGQVRRGRFHRDGTSATIIGTLSDLAEDANILARYADLLDALVEPFWPQARLPLEDAAPEDPGAE